MTEELPATIARLESKIAWWQEQAEQIDRDRAMLRYVLPVGLVAGAAGLYFKPLVGCGILSTAVVVWMMGLYITFVRRFEFRDHLREAQAELAEAGGGQRPAAPSVPASTSSSTQ